MRKKSKIISIIMCIIIFMSTNYSIFANIGNDFNELNNENIGIENNEENPEGNTVTTDSAIEVIDEKSENKSDGQTDQVSDSSQNLDPKLNELLINLYDENGNNIIDQSEADQVTEINFPNSSISSLKGMEIFNNLQTINLEGNNISDLSELANVNLDNINELNFSNNAVTNLNFLHGKNLTAIKYLYLNNNSITDISGLSTCFLPILDEINLSDNNINSITSIDGIKNATMIDFSNNDINDISGFNYLSFSRLERLNLSNNNINSIEPLFNAGLNSLWYLNLQTNNINDISGIDNISNLWTLDLSANNIEEMSSIYNLTQLKELAIRYNPLSAEQIENFNEENKLMWFDLKQNPIKSSMENGTQARVMDMSQRYLFYNSMPVIYYNNITPEQYEEDVDVNTPVIITFDREMAGNFDAIGIYKFNDDTKVISTYSLVGNTITIQPNKPLEKGTMYYIKIESGQIYDASNNLNYLPPVKKEDWWFKTDNFTPLTAVITDSNDVDIVAVNDLINLSGSESTGYPSIVEYSWDFGDNTTAIGENITKKYDAPGEYTITLTVKDSNNRTATATTTITAVDLENENYTRAQFTVVNGETLEVLEGANIKLLSKDGTTYDLISDSQGFAEIILPRDEYSISYFKKGYQLRKYVYKLSGPEYSTKLGLLSESIVSGSLTVTEMTIDEIIEAGIDIDDPDNNHVFKFETTFVYKAGAERIELPLTYYKNSKDKIISGSGNSSGWFKFDFGSKSKEYNTIRIKPINEHFYLVISGEAKWLKEMFKVELILVNNSKLDYIEDAEAEIVLPEGLSFATMKDDNGISSADRSNIYYFDKIDTAQSAAATWYIAGDEAGEYNLSVKAEGLIQPNTEEFCYEYTTSEPIKVLAGNALKLVYTIPDATFSNENYTIKMGLENVSEKPIYNLYFKLNSLSQYEVKFGEDKLISSDSLDEVIEIVELGPGEVATFEIETNILFQSILERFMHGNDPLSEEMIRARAAMSYIGGTLNPIGNYLLTNLRVEYYLTDMFTVALEGSTTEIPVEYIVEKTPATSFYTYLSRFDIFDIAIDIADSQLQGLSNAYTLSSLTYETFNFKAPTSDTKVKMYIKKSNANKSADLKIEGEGVKYNSDGSIEFVGDATISLKSLVEGVFDLVLELEDEENMVIKFNSVVGGGDKTPYIPENNGSGDSDDSDDLGESNSWTNNNNDSNDTNSDIVKEDLQDAIKEDKTPIIKLEDNDEVYFNGKDLLDNANINNNDLVVEGKDISITINRPLIDSWKIEEDSTLKCTLTLSDQIVDKDVKEKLYDIDELNEELIKKIYNIEVTLDGKKVITNGNSYKVTVDVSDLKLTDEQKQNFTGIYYDSNLKTFIQLGGEFSKDGKTFTFYSPYLGNIGAIITDDIVKIKLTIEKNEYNVNGETYTNDVTPIIENNIAILPIRLIAESLGAEVEWISETRTVVIIIDGKRIFIPVDVILPDGMGIAKIINNRTYVPIRYIIDQLDAIIVWEADTREIYIYK